MAEVLVQLETVLRSNQKDKITLEEELVFHKCKAKVANGLLTIGALSSALVWGATRNLNSGARVGLSLCTAFALGVWRCNSSLKTCVQDILAAEGSRMQRELKDILLAQKNDMLLKSPSSNKYMYPEQVFSDTDPDKLVTRWRVRSHYEDSVAVHRTHENSRHEKHPSATKNNTRSGGVVLADPADVNVDPLDVILGYPGGSSEISLSDRSPSPSRRTRAHKRAAQRRTHHSASPEPSISSMQI